MTILTLDMDCECHWQEFGGLNTSSMPDVMELLEQCRNMLDDVWRQTDFEPYPQTRMVRLMDVVGGTLTYSHVT